MKALVGAFNQEKILVGAFSVITNLRMDLFEGRPPQPGDKNLGNLRRKFCKEQWQEVAGGVGIQQRGVTVAPCCHITCSAVIRHPGRLYTREEVARLATTTDHVPGGCPLQPPAASHNQLRRVYLPTFNPLNAKISSVSRQNKLRPH